MYSIDFPKMFTYTKTNLIKDKEATLSNLKLLLASSKLSLFGDPYYGTNIIRIIYENNDVILQDLVIDEIYTSIVTFMPQLRISRRDIKVYADKVDLWADIRCTNLLDYTTDLYSIRLTNSEESK